MACFKMGKRAAFRGQVPKQRTLLAVIRRAVGRRAAGNESATPLAGKGFQGNASGEEHTGSYMS